MSAYISAIGTATPANKYDQNSLAQFMCDNMHILSPDEKKKLKVLYRATGIQERHSVLEDYKKSNGSFTFYENTPDLEPFPSTGRRMKLYKEKALPLAIEAIEDCIGTNQDFSSFTHLITVSCTGMYAPGLDVDLIKALKLDHDIRRTCVNFMGCFAAMNALNLAKEFCDNNKARVLIVAVELCSIHMQKSNKEDDLLAHSLFADGAAATIVQSDPQEPSLEIVSSHSHLSLEGQDEMAWQIGDFGFQMALTSYVPHIIEKGIQELTQNLLDKTGIKVSEIHQFAIHPGGKKILEAIESELGISKTDNRFAYHVLRHYGNMSSPTILFVLKEYFKEFKADENVLSFAFGPGLTMESILFKSRA